MSDDLRPSRRSLVQGVAAAGVAAPVLAACGSSGGSGSQTADGESVATIRCQCHGSRFSAVDGSVLSGPASSPLDLKAVSVSDGDVAVDGTDLGAAQDVPVGGGTIFADEKVVVTQPEAGQFKAFSAVCTHQGCVVSSVEPA